MLLLLSCIVLLPDKSPVFSFSSELDARYCFYTSNANIDVDEVDVVKNGDMYFVSCKSNFAQNVKQQLDSIDGESISFQGTKNDALKFLSQFDYEIVFTEMVEDIFIIYAYCPKITNCVYVNNQKINIELAVNKSNITIGTPLIIGSY